MEATEFSGLLTFFIEPPRPRAHANIARLLTIFRTLAINLFHSHYISFFLLGPDHFLDFQTLAFKYN